MPSVFMIKKCKKIDEFMVKLSGGVQTLGNKYLVFIDDSSETKNENTKYIMYDMETHKEVVDKALKLDFIEQNDAQRRINRALQE